MFKFDIKLNHNKELVSIVREKNNLLKISNKQAMPKNIPQKIISLHFGFSSIAFL